MMYILDLSHSFVSNSSYDFISTDETSKLCNYIYSDFYSFVINDPYNYYIVQ